MNSLSQTCFKEGGLSAAEKTNSLDTLIPPNFQSDAKCKIKAKPSNIRKSFSVQTYFVNHSVEDKDIVLDM